MKLVLTLSFLVLTAGCAQSGSTPTASGDTLVPTCSPVGDGTLSTFNADGSFRVTSRGVLSNGSLAANVCDGAVERIVFVSGLKAGTARNHQEGVFTDANNTVVYADDLAVTSLEPVTPKGLTGVTVQCSPIGGCGDAAPAPNKPAEAPAAPTSDATPTPAPADAKVAAGS